MPSFHWSQAFVTSVPEIDAEHRTLFRLAENLRRGLIAGVAGTSLDSMASELTSHTVSHFAHEERSMRAAAYPHYDWHKRQHAVARATAKRLERRIRSGDSDGALDLLEYFSGWLKNHIRLSDRMLGGYLRNYERERTARAS